MKRYNLFISLSKCCGFAVSATVLFIMNAACKPFKHKSNIEIVEVKHFSHIMGESFYRVFYFDTVVVYQSQYRFDSSIDHLKYDSINNNIYTDKSIRLSKWRDKFFIFHKDSLYGYWYDAYRPKFNKLRIKVDSATEVVKGLNRWDSFLTIKPDTLIWNAGKTELIEIFIFRNANGIPESRLNLYYSKKLNHLKESFNHKVDSVKKMKLFRTAFSTRKQNDYNDDLIWSVPKYITEMSQDNIQVPNDLLKYVSMYLKTISHSNGK